MALGSTFAVMAILLAETLITLGAPLQRWCQCQEAWVPITRGLAFHQQAADELWGDLLGGTGEEGLGEVLGGLGGYGSGCVRLC